MRWLTKAALFGVGLTVAACRFGDVRTDVRQLERHGTIKGRVEAVDWNGDPLVVVVLKPVSQEARRITVLAHQSLARPGSYEFVLPPGRYHIGVYEDRDHDVRLDLPERATRIEEPVVVKEGVARELPTMTITNKPRPPGDKPRVTVNYQSIMAIGERADLKSPRFGKKAGEEGMWMPVKAARTYPVGLFVLGGYEQQKTPVLFVHGMTGHASEFQSLISKLDASRFQPWVFQYPSGLPLDLPAKGIQRAVVEMHAKHAFERMCVVAHSMGGLVTRRFLTRHLDDFPQPLVRGFVTIASPLGGVPSAEMGVKWAPSVVPAWRDLSPKSKFLQKLYAKPLPASIEYHLLFTYQDEGGDDGVIELRSQVRAEAQREAEVVRGFETSHTDALTSVAVSRQVNSLLDRCRGDRADAPRVADRSF